MSTNATHSQECQHFGQTLDGSRMPVHVAIIMDGNGRWAQARGYDRSQGHVEGVNTVRRITEAASEMGLKYLTLYTFSTENWNRPKEEVDTLMNLIVMAIERETPDLIKNNVRLTTIGHLARLPQFARERLQKCIDDTSHCTGLTLALALSYSARWDLTQAMAAIAREIGRGQMSAMKINDDDIASHLTTHGMPDPDLLIRTGGDMRLSNFLLWEAAYAELIFTKKYWPDYSKEDFARDIAEYQRRQRRFGLTGEQVNSSSI